MMPRAATAPDPLDTVDYSLLTQVHPDYRQWFTIWDNYRLLYRGGEEFLRAAGQAWDTRAQANATNAVNALVDPLASAGRRRRFLYQLEGEPNVKYISRWERAYYIGYTGAIVDYFRHWLFSQPPVIRPEESEEAPDWWEDLFRSADGSKTSLLDFARDVFLDVLVLKRAGWLIATPQDTAGLSIADAEASGAGRPMLTKYGADEILNWDHDETGALRWVLLRKKYYRQDWPEARRMVELFTYVDRERMRAWETTGADADGSQRIRVVDDREHGLGEVPFVWLEVPEGLWPLNKLASWQVDLFNKMSMLSYGQLVSCFLQPFIKSNDDGATGRIFGEGIVLNLRAASPGAPEGEEFGWAAPSIDPLEFSAKQILEQRDEGYRIVHQMALAVDSQAIGAIARSGASKIEDRRASEIILAAYGGYVRQALIQTANLISRAMGDGLKWICDGFDNFQVSTLDEELTTAALVQSLNIPSQTFKREMLANLATGRILGHVDEAVKDEIRKEIADAVEQEAETPPLPPPADLPPPTDKEAPEAAEAPDQATDAPPAKQKD